MDIPSYQLCLYMSGLSFVWSSWQRLPSSTGIIFHFRGVCIYYLTSSPHHPLPLSKNSYYFFPLLFIDSERLRTWNSGQQFQPFPIRQRSPWHLIRLTQPLLTSCAQNGCRNPSPRFMLHLSFLQGPFPSGHASACQPFRFCIFSFSFSLSTFLPLLCFFTSL